jgi:multidrug transporter EmrE-like cation transporter
MSKEIAGIVITEAFADWRLGTYAKTGNPVDMYIGYAGYAFAVSLFIKAIQKKGLGWSNSQWDGWSNLASGAVAIFLLKEKPSQKELMGMALISTGLFLLGGEGTNGETKI